MFPAFLTTILFSISAISGNRCAKVFGGLEANFYRLLIATTLLSLYWVFLGDKLSGDVASLFVLSGVIGVGAGDMLFFQALPRLGSRLTVLLIQCLSVPIAAVVEWCWLGTTMSLLQLFWVAIILGSIVLALAPGAQAAVPLTSRNIKIGVLFAVAAAFGNGLGAVLSRKAYALAQVSSLSVDGPTAAFNRVIGGLLVAGGTVVILRWPVILKAVTTSQIARPYAMKWREVWPWVITTSLAGQTLGVTCFQWALKTHPTGVVLPIVALTPLVAIPFAHYFEGERASRRSLAGGVIAVTGVIALLKLA